jgi:penicillin amidase
VEIPHSVTGWEERIGTAAADAVPPVEGELRVPGLTHPVEVIRDRWGVPHVYAERREDLFLAQGYVTASERLFQIELLHRTGLGRLSELFGALSLPLDRFIRTVGWNRAAHQQVRAYDDLSLEMSAAFQAGVRAWVETMTTPPVEYLILEADPWVPDGDEAVVAGAAAGVALAWSLSRNWDAELLRAEIAERVGPEVVRALFPDAQPEAAAMVAGKDAGPDRLALLEQAPLPPSGQGSNQWVVAGTRSETGGPLLANDPHLVVGVPSAWFECHLSAPGIDVLGVALPFAPGVLIGHNDRVAWGFTNTEGDVQDLFLERLSEDGTAAEFDDRWEPLTVHREEIPVRGRAPEVVEVRETRHGPLVDSYTVGVAEPVVVEGGIRHSYALRWVGSEHGVEPSVIFRMNTAGTWEEFRAALGGWHCPGQNVVYADTDGNIGYQLTGRYPIRRHGDGSFPAPGWSSEHEWESWIPFEELPRAFNPEEGFLLTANNRPHDDAYPHLVTRDFLPPFRARRIAQLLTERERHTRKSFARMQVDTMSLPAEAAVPRLLRMEPAGERQKAAVGLLARWDFALSADSAAAALYEVWAAHIARRVLRPLLGEDLYMHFHGRRQWTNAFQYQVLPGLLDYPTARWFGGDGAEARDRVLREALDAGLEELVATLGENMDSWRWGDLHRIRFAAGMARVPELRQLLTAGEVPLGGDEQTVLQGMFEPERSYRVVVAPSWRMIVDLSDLDASVGVLSPGQSGHPASSHFRDLLEAWARGDHHPLPFSRRAVEEMAEGTLRLAPRGASGA